MNDAFSFLKPNDVTYFLIKIPRNTVKKRLQRCVYKLFLAQN